MKKFLATLITVGTLFAATVPVSANSLTFYHGNDTSAKKCYAKTTQTGADNIGAMITWQLSTSNTVYYGSYETSTGYSVTSLSSKLKGKSGSSYGYYYDNGSQVHQSTAWFAFSF